jgi:hypothetical protein
LRVVSKACEEVALETCRCLGGFLGRQRRANLEIFASSASQQDNSLHLHHPCHAMLCHLFELNSNATEASRRNKPARAMPLRRALRAGSCSLMSYQWRLADDVLLQRDKSRRRSVERIFPILQSSSKRSRLAGHPPSSVFLAQHVQKEQRELGVVQVPGSSVFPCLRMSSHQLFICHRYWTT